MQLDSYSVRFPKPTACPQPLLPSSVTGNRLCPSGPRFISELTRSASLLSRQGAGADAPGGVNEKLDLQPSFDRYEIPRLACVGQIRCEIAVSVGVERVGARVAYREESATKTAAEASIESAVRVERNRASGCQWSKGNWGSGVEIPCE